MPVRSLNSSVLKWPDAQEVDAAARKWAETVSASDPRVRAIGYFGSYARGNWGVGSDVDLVVLVDRCDERSDRRGLRYDASKLPVPADVLVYTVDEWEALRSDRGFIRQADEEMVWVYREE